MAVTVDWQVWLQEFAWTEADKPVKLEARATMVPDNPKLAKQPIFCFQTMMNLLYWSCYVYDHSKVQEQYLCPCCHYAAFYDCTRHCCFEGITNHQCLCCHQKCVYSVSACNKHAPLVDIFRLLCMTRRLSIC